MLWSKNDDVSFQLHDEIWHFNTSGTMKSLKTVRMITYHDKICLECYLSLCVCVGGGWVMNHKNKGSPWFDIWHRSWTPNRIIIVFILVNGHLHPLGRFYECCVYRCYYNKKSSIYYILMIGKESTRYWLFDDVLQPLGIVGRRQHRRLSIAVFRYTERSFRVMMDFDMAQDLWLGPKLFCRLQK